MVQVISKFAPIHVNCIDYVHPWTTSCPEATAGLYLYAVKDCLRIYGTVYILALFMRGRIPTLKDIKRTLAGIIQSSAFLSATAFGYSAFLCTLRRMLGGFNIVSVSGLPVFLSSVLAILIERPSRRILLALYVSNVASETVWNMMKYRGMVSSLPYGETIIFSISVAILLYYYKGGQHRIGDKCDSIYDALRFVVGPYEENQYIQWRTEQACPTGFYHQQGDVQIPSQSVRPSTSGRRPRSKNFIFHLVTQALRVYRKLIYRIKCYGRYNLCPHPFSCLYYTMQGSFKMFGVGFGIQIVLKLLFNIQRIISKPSSIKTIFKRDLFSLAGFLGGFTGLFRAISCLLRWGTGKDNQYHALIAGFIAGITFSQYSDSTVALYVMWKMLQLTYNLGSQAGYLPIVPFFTEFLYCFSTGLLFHAAIVEPNNLRPSYWKFLHSISGGRVACMDRTELDRWGLESTKQLEEILKRTRTVAQLKHVF